MNLSEKSELCVESYSRLKNLKLVEQETLIPWQTVYWHLKKANIAVNGDKSLYGSVKDRFAHVGEEFFSKLVPNAINQNLTSFQPKIDFMVGKYGVDIKSAKLCNKYNRWSFSLKKQKKEADFFVLFGFDSNGKELQVCFLIPNEMLRDSLQTLSIPFKFEVSKWRDFLINEKDLKEFFDEKNIH